VGSRRPSAEGGRALRLGRGGIKLPAHRIRSAISVVVLLVLMMMMVLLLLLLLVLLLLLLEGAHHSAHALRSLLRARLQRRRLLSVMQIHQKTVQLVQVLSQTVVRHRNHAFPLRGNRPLMCIWKKMKIFKRILKKLNFDCCTLINAKENYGRSIKIIFWLTKVDLINFKV